jgi:hypothetical protein
MTKSVMNFVCERSNWIGNLVFAHVLFWVFGATTFIDYGYGSSSENTDSTGALQSGPYGSGVFPVSLVLMLVATFSVTNQAIAYFSTPEVAE